MKGLIIKPFWINKIFDYADPKLWEIRGSNTKQRGRISLIASGSGLIVGRVDLVHVAELTLETFKANEKYHKIPITDDSQLPYKRTYAWMFKYPNLLEKPIPYKHPQGAVIWVNLDKEAM